MDATHQELLDKYKSAKKALEKEKPERLLMQDRVKRLEQNVAESKTANTKLARDLEAKEEENNVLKWIVKARAIEQCDPWETIMK